MLPARRALVSVFDKTDLAKLAIGLARLGIEMVSTGGTLQFLRERGIPVTAVSDVTGFPEILDGRVKTLHPKVHGGILANRAEEAHLETLDQQGIERIDLVVVNLYPFRETVARGASFEETVEMIDIGGPTMVRAAAKNAAGVAVVVDPADYDRVLAALVAGRRVIPEPLRRELAVKAFRHTASYDAAISEWLAAQGSGDAFPEVKTLELHREMTLRYGENPHQGGAVYSIAGGPGVFGGFQALQGKELSWNNLLDADAARKMAGLFEEPAVVIVKHNNPCGIGRGADLAEAYRRAFAYDPVSAFGSMIAVNRPADGALAEAMADLFVEVLLAPSYDEDARARFGAKKNLRVLECPLYRPHRSEVELRADRRRVPGPAAGRVPGRFRRLDLSHAAPAHGRGAPGPGARVEGGPVREIERHRSDQRRSDRWDRRRPDEPGGFVPPGRREGPAPGGRVRGRLGRLLPLPRRAGRPRASGDHGGGPARGQQARRRDRRRRGRGGYGDAVHGNAAFPALSPHLPGPPLPTPPSHPHRERREQEGRWKRPGLDFSPLPVWVGGRGRERGQG